MNIEKLTDAQIEQLDVYCQKWLKIGLSTERTDFEKAKSAAILCYELAGLPPPIHFHLVDSPMAAIELHSKLDPKKSKKDLFNYSMYLYGCHDADWLGVYEFYKDVIGIKECEKLNGLFELAKHVCWCLFFEDTVIFQQKPISIKMDEQNRLHSEIGPSIEYADGFSVYSWHGVRIPAEWINNKASLTPKVALTWENMEQRRVACEIVGWARILRELNSTVVDMDDDPMIGILVEVDIPEIGQEKFLKVLCGTGREFALPVPPNMTTALEANAWTYGIDKDILKQLEIRT